MNNPLSNLGSLPFPLRDDFPPRQDAQRCTRRRRVEFSRVHVDARALKSQNDVIVSAQPGISFANTRSATYKFASRG